MYLDCVGGRHHSSTTTVKPAITFNKKTGKENKFNTNDCTSSVRSETELASDNRNEAEA